MAISHKDHNHPNTPAARAACRKQMAKGEGVITPSSRSKATADRLAAKASRSGLAGIAVVPRRRGDGGVVKGMKAAAGKMIKTPGDLPANLPPSMVNAISIAWREGCGVVDGYRLNDDESRILIGGTVAQVSLVWDANGRSGAFVRKLSSSVTHRCDSPEQAMAYALGDEDWAWDN